MMEYLWMNLSIKGKLFIHLTFFPFGLENVNISTQAIWVLEISCAFHDYMWKLFFASLKIPEGMLLLSLFSFLFFWQQITINLQFKRQIWNIFKQFQGTSQIPNDQIKILIAIDNSSVSLTYCLLFGCNFLSYLRSPSAPSAPIILCHA